MTPATSRRPNLLPMTLALGLALAPAAAWAQADGMRANPPSTMPGPATNPAMPVIPSTAPATALLPPVTTTPGAAVLARPRLSQIIGGHVYNERNERIGEVDDILLSPPNNLGSLAGVGPTAIIQVGGFLGMGGRLVTLPLGDLRWNAEREQIVMPGATKEGLGARPAFEYSMLRAR